MTTYVVTHNTSGNRRNAADSYFTGLADTYIRQQQPTNIESAATSIQTWRWNGASDTNRSVIRATLPSAPGGEELVSATLEMRVSSGDGATGNITARRILQNVVVSQTTHNIYSTGNSWDSAGAQSDGVDRVATATDTAVNPSTTAGTLVTWDLTDDVAAVYAATADYPAWLLEWTGTTYFTGRTWDSAEATDGNRPELILVFAAPSGFNPAWARNSNQVLY